MFFFWTLFLSILHLSASQGWTIITTGQTVSLPCRAGGGGEITFVKWTRSGLESDYVFLFRNNGTDAEGQHPSYKNRVNLHDSQMKDGDATLVLKNLTTDDEGTYECKVVQRGGTEYRTTVILEVGRIIRVTAGDDVILPGRVPSNYRQPDRAVEWIRGKEPDHVFLLINGTSDPVFKPPSYQNRVDLQDRQMENGNVSLLLKNVTTDDGGTYECRVRQGGGNRRKRHVDPPIISTVHLEVSPPPPPSPKQNGGDKDGQTRGHHGLAVGLPAAVIIAMAAAGIWIYKKKISAPPPQSDSGEKDPMSLLADQ